MQRQKIILSNAKSVFFDMLLALLAIGSPLNPEKYEAIIVDGGIHDNPANKSDSHLVDAHCFGLTMLM